MYNGPADRIRRAHRQDPALSPQELADELNKEKPGRRWNGASLKPISPKYVSKILRRDAALWRIAKPKYKTGPKPEAKDQRRHAAQPDAKESAKAKTPAPANRRPSSKRPARANRSRG